MSRSRKRAKRAHEISTMELQERQSSHIRRYIHAAERKRHPLSSAETIFRLLYAARGTPIAERLYYYFTPKGGAHIHTGMVYLRNNLGLRIRRYNGFISMDLGDLNEYLEQALGKEAEGSAEKRDQVQPRNAERVEAPMLNP